MTQLVDIPERIFGVNHSMLQLVLQLLGPRFVARRLRVFSILGALWLLIGCFVVLDMFYGVLWFPLQGFGLLLVAEGIATLVLARSGLSLRTQFRYLKGAIGLLVGILLVVRHSYSDLILAIFFGAGFAIEGVLLISAAWIVRYRSWRSTVALGSTNIVLAVLILQPYPTHYKGTVPYCVGMWLVLNGIRMIGLYSRYGKVLAPDKERWKVCEDRDIPMIVHVWTPVDSSKGKTARRPVIDRYIAAVDANGVISTGHAALEAGDLYLSLYPAEDIDRSLEEFARLLRADASNDVPGRFLGSYSDEAKDWCESTKKIAFRRYNSTFLAEFATRYRAQAIYNLTNRNCSSTVAYALEAALLGSAYRNGGWVDLLRLIVLPELWLAAQIRHRALTMAWTPGLTLDYATALRYVSDPPNIGLVSLALLGMRRALRARLASCSLRKWPSPCFRRSLSL